MRNKPLIYLIFSILLLSVGYANAAGTPPDSSSYSIVSKKYIWMYNIPWEWKVELPSSVLTYYQKKQRPLWKGDLSYYTKYIESNDKSVEIATQNLQNILKGAKKSYNWSQDQEIMFVVSMLQQMKYVPDSLTGKKDYVKYPAETLMDGYGDCEDKVILGAAILKKMGHDVSLIFIESDDKKSSHLALGVVLNTPKNGTYYNFNLKKYYYIETTFAGWHVGDMPDNWQGYDATIIPVL